MNKRLLTIVVILALLLSLTAVAVTTPYVTAIRTNRSDVKAIASIQPGMTAVLKDGRTVIIEDPDKLEATVERYASGAGSKSEFGRG